MNNKPILCHFCDHPPFDNFKELALHLITQKKTHKNRSSQIWAKKFLSKQEYLDKKVSRKFDGRIASTPEQLEARRESKYVLSGKTKLVSVKCPRCKMISRQPLEVEHVDNPEALKEGNCYLVLCGGCK